MRGRRESGATLIELIISIVVIAIAASAVLGLLSSTVGRSADAMVMSQAVAIAEAYLEEIALKPSPIPTASTARRRAPTFDDVDDYNGLVDNGARDQFGAALTPLAQYTVTVTVVDEHRAHRRAAGRRRAHRRARHLSRQRRRAADRLQDAALDACAYRRRQHGFTLIELVITIVDQHDRRRVRVAIHQRPGARVSRTRRGACGSSMPRMPRSSAWPRHPPRAAEQRAHDDVGRASRRSRCLSTVDGARYRAQPPGSRRRFSTSPRPTARSTCSGRSRRSRSRSARRRTICRSTTSASPAPTPTSSRTSSRRPARRS